MNILGKVQELHLIANKHCFVSALVETSDALVPFIEIYGISGAKCADKPGHTILIRLFDKKMKMVGHEAVGN